MEKKFLEESINYNEENIDNINCILLDIVTH